MTEQDKDKIIKQLKEKCYMYEGFLHDINLYAEVVMDEIAVRNLIDNACNWSYAHRVGNGEYSEEEQDEIIRAKFLKLRDVLPKEERQRIRNEKYEKTKNKTGNN